LVSGARIGLWISPNVLRDEDLCLARDLRSQGAPILLIGQNIPDDAADLVLPIPTLPQEIAHWQFLVDIIPAQLASAQLAQRLGSNCNEFVFCPYVIEAEGGLVGSGAAERG
jgi:hypothetical protein